MGEQLLEGTRVLELSEGIAGPFTGRLLAGYGADVVKVEPPGRGDWARSRGPFVGDQPDPDGSALFLHLGANKRSVTLDPSTTSGRDLLARLLTTADIVIESYRPGTLEAWGFRFDDLQRLRPAQVLTSITPFGQDGPYRDYVGEEIVYYAMGGPMSSTGLAEREPVKLGGDLVQYQAGTLAATATVAALLSAEQAEEGVHVDVSIFEAQAGSMDRRRAFLVGYAYTGRVAPRETQGPAVLPSGIFPVLDGYVQLGTIPAHLPRMAAALGDPRFDEMLADPLQFLDPGAPDVITEILFGWFGTRTKAQAMADAQAHGWAVTAVNTPRDVLGDPHFAEREFFVQAEHPSAGIVTQLGAPFRVEDGWKLRRVAPRLGQHNREVYCDELGLTPEDLAPLRAAGVI